MKKFISVCAAICLAALALTGCGNNPAGSSAEASGTQQEGGATADSEKKIAVITTVAGLGDEAFNDAVHVGVEKYCTDNGIKLTTIEPQELQDFSVNCSSLGQQGYDLVIICENSINEILKEVAPQFPNTHYVITEGSVSDIANVTSLQFRVQDVGFLCGAFAAEMSKSLGTDGTIGWVGGVRNPLSEGSQFSTQAGAAYVGGGCKSVYVGSYNDIAKAKEVGLQLYNDGIAIACTMAGGSNSGVFQAAESFPTGKYAMGAAMGQFNLSPERIVASNVKALDTFTYKVCEDFAAGTLESGIIIGGFAEQAIDLRYSPEAVFKDFVPAEVKAKMEEIKADIVSGKIVAPSTQEEYDSFIKTLAK